MLKSEIAQLLALIQQFDHRKVSAATVEAWAPVVGDLDFQEAQQAVVGYYRVHREWLYPADIVEGVLRLREQVPVAKRLPPQLMAAAEAAGISPEEAAERQSDPEFVKVLQGQVRRLAK